MKVGDENHKIFKNGNHKIFKKLKNLATFLEKIRFCGCGDPDMFLTTLRDKLQFIHDRREGVLKDAEFEVYSSHKDSVRSSSDSYFIHSMLDSWGMTEHYGSVYEQWLDAKGKSILRESNLLLSLKEEVRDEFFNYYYEYR